MSTPSAGSCGGSLAKSPEFATAMASRHVRPCFLFAGDPGTPHFPSKANLNSCIHQPESTRQDAFTRRICSSLRHHLDERDADAADRCWLQPEEIALEQMAFRTGKHQRRMPDLDGAAIGVHCPRGLQISPLRTLLDGERPPYSNHVNTTSSFSACFAGVGVGAGVPSRRRGPAFTTSGGQPAASSLKLSMKRAARASYLR